MEGWSKCSEEMSGVNVEWTAAEWVELGGATNYSFWTTSHYDITVILHKARQ